MARRSSLRGNAGRFVDGEWMPVRDVPNRYSKISQLVDEAAPTSLIFPNVFGG